MAPKSPWNKKATINTSAQTNVTPDRAASTINYGEVQSDEIELLQAMYMEDFEEVQVKGAWSKTTDRSFKLKLKSFSDDEGFVTLSIRLTATYPKTAPLLDVEGLNNYHERTQKRIRNVVNNRPKQLLGEVMIDAIANEVRDALEDAVQAKQQGTLPSLEDERANAEEVAASLARQAEEAEARLQQDSKEEEDRVLKQMVTEEINRREKRKPAKLSNHALGDVVNIAGPDVISFDRPAALQIGGEMAHFSTLIIVSAVLQKRDQEVFLAKPQPSGNVACPVVAVKRLMFERSRKDVMELESILASCQKLRNPGLLSVLAYRIDRLNDVKSELVLCTEYADRGTLHELLELGSLHVSKARQFSTEMLEALDYIHSHGVGHGNLTLSNVALVGATTISPKLSNFGYSSILEPSKTVPAKWRAPESDSDSPVSLRRSDVWQFGIIVAQMFLGLQVVSSYSSPQAMLGGLDLSDSFDDFVGKIFTVDGKKRPSAFDLLPAEFLRTNDTVLDEAPITIPQHVGDNPRKASTSFASPAKRRSRHNSSNVPESASRYGNDFTEIGRLGKGGFGEVVKARNKLDGGLYAVKKIKQASQLLDQVISEVMLLNRLNHPYVVRYFSTWIEESASGVVLEDSTTETETATETAEEESSDGPRMDFGYQSTGGLDFVSSSGYPQIEFGNEDDESSSEDGEEDELAVHPVQNGSSAVVSAEIPDARDPKLRKSRSESHRAPSTLYIQMEYCERHTLRDLVRKTMTLDESWRFARQITEGLAHIHGHGIIHRDLKPDNIFIDVAGNPKIGDFGLATTSQHNFVGKDIAMSGHSADMTRSVGTTLYVAPELHSGSGTSYNEKVDMYSLGIIFYEMCEPFSTAMERIKALQDVREKNHELPPPYQSTGERAAQGKLILFLISHKPSERPSSTELLRSDILPLKIEDETIRQALSGLSDSRSPYHQKMMSALFAHDSNSNDRVKALAWDARASGPMEDANRLRLKSIARNTLEAVFKRHGAEEARRQSIFPRSGYYTNGNRVQLLDASGNMLQLPYDLTLPHARQLARQRSDVRCTFAFGNVYRDSFTSGPPKVSEEVDFDITNDGNDDELPKNEAELLKTVDEVVCEMPLFAASTIVSFHLNHASMLDAVLEFCRIPFVQHQNVKEIISRLGFNEWTWSKIRIELRKFGLPDTTLDDLQHFDFRDGPEKAFSRIRALTEGATSRLRIKLEDAMRSLNDVVLSAQQFSVHRKLYVAPLGSVNAKFYEDGLLFQCVLERKNRRLVIAAGGRYDSLIRAHRSVEDRSHLQGCVGVSIGLDPIITSMAKNVESKSKKKYLKQQAHIEQVKKRCDAAVVASGTPEVQNAGMKLLATLWANNIGAELTTSRPANDKTHDFIITIRHEASNSVRFSSASPEAEEIDVSIAGLVSHIRQEMRDLESNKTQQPALIRQTSHYDPERKSNVQVLMARHGSKKSNKFQIVSDAQEKWSNKLDAMKEAPILAIETRDEVLDSVRSTRLSDLESWRKAVQNVQLNDRQYVQQIQEMLNAWKKKWSEGEGMREACVFNFRTQHCIYYDLAV